MKVALLLIFVAMPVLAQSPAKIESEILAHLSTLTKTGTYSGNYEEEKLYAENRILREKLMRFGKRADVLAYAFPKLKGEMFIATSKDGRLRIYSWDMNTGGTMHDFASVYQFKGESGAVHTWSEDSEEESGGSFYYQIFQVPAKTGTIYLSCSNFIGSSSLAGQSISALRITGDTLDREAKVLRTSSGLQNSISFGYDFFSVVDRPERPIKLFTFNETTLSFRFPVVIEDEKTPQGRVTNKFITYKFDGKYFVKVG